jgi:hypothetical protein
MNPLPAPPAIEYDKPATMALELWTYSYRNVSRQLDRYAYTGTAAHFLAECEKKYSPLSYAGEWTISRTVDEPMGGYRYLLIHTSETTFIFMNTYMDYLKLRAEIPESFNG